MKVNRVPKIQHVIFDIGRVLVQWDLRHLFIKLIQDRAELNWFLKHVVTEQWHFQADAGHDLADMVAQRRAQFPQYSAHLDAYASRFLESIPGPVPGSFEIVEELAARRVPLFAITNFGAEFWDQFRPTQPILDHFQGIVVSGQEKLVKPDAAIFTLACTRFGIEPHSALFIDDNAANVEAARGVGMTAHLFVDAPQLRAHLGKLGLL